MGTQGQRMDVVILSGKRTGFGSFGGSLRDLSATELGVVSAKAAMRRRPASARAKYNTSFTGTRSRRPRTRSTWRGTWVSARACPKRSRP